MSGGSVPRPWRDGTSRKEDGKQREHSWSWPSWLDARWAGPALGAVSNRSVPTSRLDQPGEHLPRAELQAGPVRWVFTRCQARG